MGEKNQNTFITQSTEIHREKENRQKRAHDDKPYEEDLNVKGRFIKATVKDIKRYL